MLFRSPALHRDEAEAGPFRRLKKFGPPLAAKAAAGALNPVQGPGVEGLMLSAALLLFANTLLFSLRLSGGGSFPKPLSAAEEREWLEKYANGDPEARQVLIERNLRLVAHIINNG